LKTVGLVAFLCLLIYFAKDGKLVFESIFLDTVGDALMMLISACFVIFPPY
jgi:hypothetical protein